MFDFGKTQELGSRHELVDHSVSVYFWFLDCAWKKKCKLIILFTILFANVNSFLMFYIRDEFENIQKEN